eukprot:g1846.t1
MPQLARARRLADSGGVSFDCQVSAETQEAAEALNTKIKGGDAAEDTQVLMEFVQQIEEVKKDPEYDDVPANFDTPTVALVTQVGQLALETPAPTPMPPPTPAMAVTTPASGSDESGNSMTVAGVPITIVAGAGGGVIVLAAVMLRLRKKRTPMAEVVNVKTGVAQPQNPTLEDIYPGAAIAKPSQDQNNADAL